MAEVPPGSSGIGSALFNSCRQIGTAMGLAILGSVAASVILAEWHRRAGSLPPAGRQAASRLAADVAGGQAHLVAASAGQDLLDPAIASFLHGFEIALLLAGVILAAGMHASRLDGSPMRYNQLDPYLPDFVMCRAEVAPILLDAIRQAWG